jgi:hypothetical protein
VRVSRDAPPWLVGAVGLAIAAIVAIRLLVLADMNPTVFIALGEDSVEQTAYAQRLLGDVVTRPHARHDGKFIFIQANDPWYLEPEDNAALLDRPIYRAQRMMFPLIVGGLGLSPPSAIVWLMGLVNVLALGMGAWLAARLAIHYGATAWLGLAVPLNVGLHFELDIGGVYALARDHVWIASLFLAAGALTREVMLVFAFGVFLLCWLERRQPLWRLVLVPTGAMGIWSLYLWPRLHDIVGVGGGPEAFTLPFAGILEGIASWAADPFQVLPNLVLLAVIVSFVPLALRSRLPIAWGALALVALSTTLSVNVWAKAFDFARALAPVFTAFAFLVFTPSSDPGLQSQTPGE